jgi:hypothetical protein
VGDAETAVISNVLPKDFRRKLKQILCSKIAPMFAKDCQFASLILHRGIPHMIGIHGDNEIVTVVTL